jgi:hypothetical protein
MSVSRKTAQNFGEIQSYEKKIEVENEKHYNIKILTQAHRFARYAVFLIGYVTPLLVSGLCSVDVE